MKVVAWDVEIYPDLFSIAAIDCYTGEEWGLLQTADDGKSMTAKRLEVKNFFDFIAADILVSYNGLSFDVPVTHYAEQVGEPRRVAAFANSCIKNHANRTGDERSRVSYHKMMAVELFGKTQHLDLLLLFNKVDRVSLKKLAIGLGWYLIQDLPYPPGSKVQHVKNEVMMYNYNDSRITKEVYTAIYGEIKLRYDISGQYKVDVLCASRSVTGSKLMQKMYLDAHPEINEFELSQGRTRYKHIEFDNVIADNIKFEATNLIDLHQEMLNLTFSSNISLNKKNMSFDKLILIGKTKYSVGFGGLHSTHEPEFIETNEHWEVIDADVASYYPTLMIQQGVYPKHLGEGFLELFKKIVEQRLAAKHAGIKLTADALKIVINAIFGKMGSEHEWFFDLEALYKVTINGQLYLLMLTERLEKAGIDVFYANTDGITARVPRTLKKKYYEICAEWEKELGFDLEYMTIEKMMIRDVNNYTLRTTDGKLKEKGEFNTKPPLGKSRNALIVATAINKWFYENEKVEATIMAETALDPFLMSGKVGPTYARAEFHTIGYGDMTKKIKQLQRVNRYYCSKGKLSGSLLKVKDENGKITYSNMLKGWSVTIANDFTKLDNSPINYLYYVNRARSFLAQFQKQELLF